MATYLTKAVKRRLLIEDREWEVSLLPPDEVYRFARIQFREKRARKVKYWLPMESARNMAAERWLELANKEKKRLRKERAALRASL